MHDSVALCPHGRRTGFEIPCSIDEFPSGLRRLSPRGDFVYGNRDLGTGPSLYGSSVVITWGPK